MKKRLVEKRFHCGDKTTTSAANAAWLRQPLRPATAAAPIKKYKRRNKKIFFTFCLFVDKTKRVRAQAGLPEESILAFITIDLFMVISLHYIEKKAYPWSSVIVIDYCYSNYFRGYKYLAYIFFKPLG